MGERMPKVELAARNTELVRMFSAFADRPSEDRLKIYIEETAQYSWPVFVKAVREATRNHMENMAPSVGKIRERAATIAHQVRQTVESYAPLGIENEDPEVGLRILKQGRARIEFQIQDKGMKMMMIDILDARIARIEEPKQLKE